MFSSLEKKRNCYFELKKKKNPGGETFSKTFFFKYLKKTVNSIVFLRLWWIFSQVSWMIYFLNTRGLQWMYVTKYQCCNLIFIKVCCDTDVWYIFDWPSSAQICNCTSVNRARLIASGWGTQQVSAEPPFPQGVQPVQPWQQTWPIIVPQRTTTSSFGLGKRRNLTSRNQLYWPLPKRPLPCWWLILSKVNGGDYWKFGDNRYKNGSKLKKSKQKTKKNMKYGTSVTCCVADNAHPLLLPWGDPTTWTWIKIK